MLCGKAREAEAQGPSEGEGKERERRGAPGETALPAGGKSSGALSTGHAV